MVIQDHRKHESPASIHDLTSVEALDTLPYVDFPEIRVDKHESVQMPFRYLKDGKGRAIMPQVIEPFQAS